MSPSPIEPLSDVVPGDGACYHCGLPRPPGTDFPVRIGGEVRQMCCAGCQAVAQAIVDNGLDGYYRHRDALPESPREAVPAVLDELLLYDHAEVQKSFVRALGEHEREASLLLEGITCAACVWLNERHLSALPGVAAVDINYATRRARVRWDESRIRLSDILAAVAAIGYRAYPYDAAKNEELAKKERRQALWRLFVAGFGMMQVMMYAVPVYLAGEGEMSADIEAMMRWASLALTLPVVFYASAPFFRNAWRDLMLRRLGMDVPVALGVGATFVASLWGTLTGSGEVYYDSIAMFVFFLLGGRFLEMTGRQRAVRQGERLARLQPAFAQRLDDGGMPVRVAVSDLQPGDRVLVRPGETLPADGRVLEGESEADEALLTGESCPVPKRPGDAVIGGATNVASPLLVAVERVGSETRLSAIVRLMERAALERPRVVELADRIAARFIAAVLLVAAAAALWWWQSEPSRALWIAVSVLVVTCPCALSLATPMALTVAHGAFARAGLLVTRGHAIEALAHATHFVFDKTGTLTFGRPRLLRVVPLRDLDEERCLELAAALEQGSEHPLAQALRREADGRALPQACGLRSVTGRGVEAEIDGARFRLGRPGYVLELAPAAAPSQFDEGGDTVVWLGDGKGLLARLHFGDAVRPEAHALMDDLRRRGCAISLLTGDGEAAAQAVAGQLGIGRVYAAAMPDDKHAYVLGLQREGAVVAMVGDGVNDAPVLALAQVSVAMGGAADLARQQADMVLLADSLEPLRQGLGLAARTLAVIRQNLSWSVIYNFAALPLAVAGLIAPWLAGIGMSASSLLVVLNSLRLQRRM